MVSKAKVKNHLSFEFTSQYKNNSFVANNLEKRKDKLCSHLGLAPTRHVFFPSQKWMILNLPLRLTHPMTLCTETNFYIGAPLGKALESTSRNMGVTESVPGSGLAPETAVGALADMSPEPRSLAGQGRAP